MNAALLSILLSFATVVAAQQPAPPALPSPPSLTGQLPDIPADQLQALISDLEDPATRERLIQQLKTLAQIKEATAQPESEVQDATAELLKAISNQVQGLQADIVQLLDYVDALPQTVTWLQEQIANPQTRQVWQDTLLNLALVLGAGYIAWMTAYFLVLYPRRRLAYRVPETLSVRLLFGFFVLLLNLLPVAAFAVAAYLTLGLVDPDQQVRLVALAWINAAVITRLVLAISRTLFAPRMPRLRLFPMDDEAARYAHRWVRRLGFVAVYGYFGLQAGLLLGLPELTYAAALRLLGFVVALLLLLFVLQNRATVAAYIRGPQSQDSAFKALRRRLAQVWFVLAMLYVLVLYGIWALQVDGGFWFLLQASTATLLILMLGHYLVRFVDAIFAHGFHISRAQRSRFPGLESRANRYVPLLRWGCRWLIYGLMIIAILQFWGIDTFPWLATEPGRILLTTAATILGIVAVSVFIWELAGGFIESYLARQEAASHSRVHSNRVRTLLGMGRNALLVVLVLVAVLLILAELGMDITPLLAGAGVIGVAVGFGSQKLVQDVITGAFILFEDLISVGDVVNVGDKGGLVEAVSIRNVQLRDLTGAVHTIPYSAITTVSNLTKEFSYYLFDVGIAYREDVDQVMEVLSQIGSEMQQDRDYMYRILEPLEILGVDAFADSAVIIKARIKTLPIEQWNVGREFNRRMKKRFDQLGIEIPFPHRTLYFGVDKKGAAPPARVRMSPGVRAEAASASSLEKIGGAGGPAQYNVSNDLGGT